MYYTQQPPPSLRCSCFHRKLSNYWR